MDPAIGRQQGEVARWHGGIEDHGRLGGTLDPQGLGQLVEELAARRRNASRPIFGPDVPRVHDVINRRSGPRRIADHPIRILMQQLPSVNVDGLPRFKLGGPRIGRKMGRRRAIRPAVPCRTDG